MLTIRLAQERLVAIADTPGGQVVANDDGALPLEAFLEGLRISWRGGKIRPTARAKPAAKRERRRPDPLLAAVSRQRRAATLRAADGYASQPVTSTIDDPSGSTSWIFWEHSDEMTGNILARQWHPRLGTSTDEAIRIPILIVALHTGEARLSVGARLLGIGFRDPIIVLLTMFTDNLNC